MTREEARIKLIEIRAQLEVILSMYGLEISEVFDMAIKALSAEPCEDCISRQAVLDIINFEDKWLLDAKGHNADTRIAFSGMKSGIADLPPVTPKPKMGHWIPVSERLPEEETDVLICNKQGEIEIGQGSRFTDIDAFIWYTSGWRFGEVIAWQPLPEPYKAESEDKE